MPAVKRILWFDRQREWFTAGVGRWSLTVIWSVYWCRHWYCCHWLEPRHRMLKLGPVVMSW